MPKSWQVYPRVCGGTRSGRDSRRRQPGLSPRVRGNPMSPAKYPSWQGSIPACAGEPFLANASRPGYAVYPRVCGGTAGEAGQPAPGGGLSPRVRGNPLLGPLDLTPWRSIPACAGEPTLSGTTYQYQSVYPRVCGGTSASERVRTANVGLSPRVRGNQPFILKCFLSAGSIPACAGEPRKNRSAIGRNTVYPRVCGGTISRKSR